MRSLCVHSFTLHRTRRDTHDSILPFRHILHTHVTRPQATSTDYTAVHRRQPARLRPSTPRRCGSCAAALGTTTTVACQVVGSRARYHRVQTATMAGRGAKAGTARRARGGGRAHPAIRHRVCIRTRSGVRRLTILVPIGAAFGHGTRTHTLSRTLTGREASKCAVRPQSAARAEHLSRAPGEQSTTTGAPKSADSPLGSSDSGRTKLPNPRAPPMPSDAD